MTADQLKHVKHVQSVQLIRSCRIRIMAGIPAKCVHVYVCTYMYVCIYVCVGTARWMTSCARKIPESGRWRSSFEMSEPLRGDRFCFNQATHMCFQNVSHLGAWIQNFSNRNVFHKILLKIYLKAEYKSGPPAHSFISSFMSENVDGWRRTKHIVSVNSLTE